MPDPMAGRDPVEGHEPDATAEHSHDPETASTSAGRGPGASRTKLLLWSVVVLLLLGSAALWGSSRLTWAEMGEGVVAGDSSSDGVTGADLVNSLTPVAALVLATVAAVLALSGKLRRLLGVALVVLIGGWTAYEIVRGEVFDVSTVALPGYAEYGQTVTPVFWGPALACAAVLLIVAAGVLLFWRGHRMPGMGAKYSAPGAGRASDPDTEMWNALSDGEDPTSGSDGDPSAPDDADSDEGYYEDRDRPGADGIDGQG